MVMMEMRFHAGSLNMLPTPSPCVTMRDASMPYCFTSTSLTALARLVDNSWLNSALPSGDAARTV